jgi:amidase
VTIGELQKRFKTGELTSEGITRMYLSRIEQVDKSGPTINSVIEVNPDAVKIARKMDEERKAGKVRGSLHGIPVLIKDNIDTADQMMTTAGSLALMNHRASKDAFIVKKLREAGAVILGKTNLSEWANFRSTRSSSGWSSRGGQTKNPYILDRSPCGSSSGSAVAVAANLCVVAVGTETNGSIACPASMTSVVGIKPTVGLVSRAGIIPISKTQDTAGPFARTVRDAAILLGAMAGVDPDDPVTLESKGKEVKDYTAYLDSNGLKGKRIGIEKTLLRGHEAIDQQFQKALEQMKKAGAAIVEVEFMKQYNSLGDDETTVLEYEFKEGINQYLSTANAPVRSLQEVITFNNRNAAKAMPFFKQELLDSSQARGGLDSAVYKEAYNKLMSVREFINKLFNENNLDALCGPATGLPWCIDLINGDFFTGYGAYGPAAVAGYPSITIPLGNVNELPFGLSFFGRAFSEPQLIAIGYSYEQASKNRIIPRFRKTFSTQA